MILAATAYVVLGEIIIGIFAALLSIFLSSCIIRFYLKRRSNKSMETSPMFIAYFIIEILTNLVVIVLWSFLASSWNGVDSLYDIWAMFWFTVPTGIIISLRSIYLFFLAVDRIFCILFPFKYVKNWKILPILLSIFGSTLTTTYLIIVVYIAPYGKSGKTDCFSYGCLLPTSNGQLYHLSHYVLAIPNVLAGIILLFYVKKTFAIVGDEWRKRNHKLVLASIIVTLVLDFFPQALGGIWTLVFQQSGAVYFGPYSGMFVSLESLSCAIIYWRSFKRHRKMATHQISLRKSSQGFALNKTQTVSYITANTVRHT